jgi:hypothetical protein
MGFRVQGLGFHEQPLHFRPGGLGDASDARTAPRNPIRNPIRKPTRKRPCQDASSNARVVNDSSGLRRRDADLVWRCPRAGVPEDAPRACDPVCGASFSASVWRRGVPALRAPERKSAAPAFADVTSQAAFPLPGVVSFPPRAAGALYLSCRPCS